MSSVRQVLILVGGKGTRLGSLTAATPKPLLPVVGELSMLDLLLENAARFGYRQIILLAGHFGEQLVERYDGSSALGASVKVVREPEPLGTAGAIAFAADLLEDRFVLMNGDSIFDINLRALELSLGEAEGVIALRQIEDAARFGTVVFERGKVTQFLEKTGEAKPALINGGVYVLRRSVAERVVKTPCSLETDVFPRLCAEGALAGVIMQGHFIDIGLPETLAQARHELGDWRRRPIAFLDRDGVLNVDTGWPHLPAELQFVDGAPEAVRVLNEAGFYVIVASNQAGVARGMYDEAQVGVFNAAVAEELALRGAHIDAFYYCPYHPQAAVAAYRMDSADRKPKPGMLLRAFVDWPSRPAGSFLVGDKASDIDAAKAAGIPGYLFSGGSLRDLISQLPEVAARRDR